MRYSYAFEDIEIGMELPALIKNVTTRQLVMWAGASADLYEIHYDKDFALRQGLPGVIVHGRLKAAFLGQLLSDWIESRGMVKKLTCSYRKIDVPGTLLCRGKVIRKYYDQEELCVECEVWIENSEGQRTTDGKAVVTMSSNGRKGEI